MWQGISLLTNVAPGNSKVVLFMYCVFSAGLLMSSTGKVHLGIKPAGFVQSWKVCEACSSTVRTRHLESCVLAVAIILLAFDAQ